MSWIWSTMQGKTTQIRLSCVWYMWDCSTEENVIKRMENTCRNSNKSPTRCNNFPVYYPDVYLQLNMFRAFSRPSLGAQQLQ
jgi:hypothetical protein